MSLAYQFVVNAALNLSNDLSWQHTVAQLDKIFLPFTKPEVSLLLHKSAATKHTLSQMTLDLSETFVLRWVEHAPLLVLLYWNMLLC